MANQGLSHLVFTAPSSKLRDKTVEFYTAVGFQVVKEDIDIQSVWLTLFGESSCTIKIVVGAQVARHKDIRSKDVDWRLEAEQIWITVHSIQTLEQTLRTLDVLYQKYAHPKSNPKDPLSTLLPVSHTLTEIYVQDPLNNLVIFTNQANPYSKVLLQQINEIKNLEIKDRPTSAPCGGKRRKRIGILTSGGDSPGMNAVVRAVVRVSITRGCEAFAIYEGYQGLVDGGNMIRKMEWDDVRGYLHIGGTLIGTARCMPFKTRPGRLQAALNLIENGIDALIVCGGDGSLTGADLFRSEWPGLLQELLDSGKVVKEQIEPYSHLTIVGLVGSIDNDMSGTDITIGAVTSLHRICESLDAITSTALSHSRAFVVEVMGRHCGWLALMAGIASGADFIIIPEKPPSADTWETDMCESLIRHRKLGKRKSIIILSEGAIDDQLNPIKAEQVRQILADRLGLDTRVTTLGHVQRGGAPVAYDRYLGTIQGVEAVEAVLRSTPDTPSPMIGMSQNKLTWEPLMEAVEKTHSVAEAIGRKDFKTAMSLRDSEFVEDFQAFTSSIVIEDNNLKLPETKRLRIAIISIGAPAGGMNAATRVAVRYALSHGHTPLAIFNGFTGLLQDQVRELDWLGVDGWQSRGGSEIGTNRSQPNIDLGMVAFQFQKHNIQGLLIIGGFEAYTALLMLNAGRDKYPAFCIPLVHLPATISNNVPGTDYSLGSDTSLNAIVVACDAIKQSASASRRRVFIVEVQGGQTGYLAVLSALCTGANSVYIPEEGISLSLLQKDVNHLIQLYKIDNPLKSEGRLILRNETASNTYTTEVISQIITSEGAQRFDSRTAVLGHTSQGGAPSPLDRIRATRLAVKCINFIEDHHNKSIENTADAIRPPGCQTEESAAIIGIRGSKTVFTPAKELLKETDMKLRKSNKSWWLSAKGLVNLLTWKVSHDECNGDRCPILEEVDLILGGLDPPVRY